MIANVEWTGKSKNGEELHKKSSTEVPEFYDKVQNKDRIYNHLKKEISNFYEVEIESIKILNLEFDKTQPEVPSKDEYDVFVDNLSESINIKIADLENEIAHLTEMKTKFEELKKKVMNE